MSRGVAFDNQKPAAYVGLDAVSFIMSDLRRPSSWTRPDRPSCMEAGSVWRVAGGEMIPREHATVLGRCKPQPAAWPSLSHFTVQLSKP
jgi:hypothetical protein